MSPILVSIMAEVFACNARIIAMQAENAQRAAEGSSPAYREKDFIPEIDLLTTLSMEARNVE